MDAHSSCLDNFLEGLEAMSLREFFLKSKKIVVNVTFNNQIAILDLYRVRIFPTVP